MTRYALWLRWESGAWDKFELSASGADMYERMPKANNILALDTPEGKPIFIRFSKVVAHKLIVVRGDGGSDELHHYNAANPLEHPDHYENPLS